MVDARKSCGSGQRFKYPQARVGLCAEVILARAYASLLDVGVQVVSEVTERRFDGGVGEAVVPVTDSSSSQMRAALYQSCVIEPRSVMKTVDAQSTV